MKFLDMKLTLIKQLKLPFDAYEFKAKDEPGTFDPDTTTARATLHGR